MRVGLHYNRYQKLKGGNKLDIFCYYIFVRLLLLRAGDIQLKPGPESDTDSEISFTSDILNIISCLFITTYKAHYNKLDQIESELSNFDLISVTETWFTADISGFRSR